MKKKIYRKKKNIYISENIYLMYLMCGFETAWNKKFESPWCKVFSLHDFKVYF